MTFAAMVCLAVVLAIVPFVLRRDARTIHLVRTADQNVLLVTVDTLRADALRIDGGRADTPALDRLARSGIRFDFAHAHAVVTLPSHASILTGLYPFQHEIRDNSGFRLPSKARSLATVMKAAGFARGAFVGAFPLDSRFGLDRDFDVYDERYAQAGLPSAFAIPERRAELVVDAAMRWIDGQRTRWFAWLHLYDPHAPYQAPEPFAGRYANDPYAGEVAYVDASLAPLFEKLRSAARPTFVIVTGDHGEALGDHGELTHGLFAYEATLRVPFVISQVTPGQPEEAGAALSSLPVRHVDIFPTMLDAAAISAPADLPGRSLLPDIERGTNGPEAADRPSYFEAMSTMLNRGWAPLRGIIVNREKYIELPTPEVYDLRADPREESNLSDRRPERLRALSAHLRDLGAAAEIERRDEAADVRARLQALGYVSGTAPPKVRYTEDDDPKRLISLDQAIARGVELYEQGRVREAIQLYRDVIGKRPGMPFAYLQLASLFWESGDVRSATETLQNAISAGARTNEVQARLGTYLAETGEAKKALTLLEPAAAASTPDVDALNALGIAYARADQPDKALLTFVRILTLDRDNGMAVENIGSVHLSRGHLTAAQAAFEKALGINPQSARAHAGLGVVQRKSGNVPAALASWTRAVELDPRDYDSLFNLATELVRQGRREEARLYLERFVATAPPALYGADIARLKALLQQAVSPTPAHGSGRRW
ncbi:MAG: sulfatase-like hydrolase/transferase [Acidobacteria bacterium]|nr:sulfatase-like hydrolase/transferase [Acidobacteriota bacterium]